VSICRTGTCACCSFRLIAAFNGFALLAKGDVIRVIQNARDAGKARFIGYSGDGEDAAAAIKTGVFDTLQTSVNIADQACIDLTLPLAAKANMGVIAKRPIANAAWKTGAKPASAYHHEYWRRLESLHYGFLKGDLNSAVSIALRFTLAQLGVATAIVGTANPDRWAANARLLEAGPLDPAEIEAIRDRWRTVAAADWVSQN
ncbi:MAG: aldo/keto reductase, partial [Bryobacteraceae bacterium]